MSEREYVYPTVLTEVTHVIEHSPNCAKPFMVRLPGHCVGRIDKRPRDTTRDAIGYGNTPREAAENAFAELERQRSDSTPISPSPSL